MAYVVGSGGGGPKPGRWSLQGMTALVTGGTRGIGHAVVEELAEFGATVHTCSRKEGELSECLKKWEAQGLRVTGSVCDLSVPDQRADLMRKVSSLFDGKLNILVTNLCPSSSSLSFFLDHLFLQPSSCFLESKSFIHLFLCTFTYYLFLTIETSTEK